MGAGQKELKRLILQLGIVWTGFVRVSQVNII